MRDNFAARGIDVMVGSARSPDLSPNEKVWGVMTERVYRDARQFAPVSLLKQTIVCEWQALDATLRHVSPFALKSKKHLRDMN